MLKWNLAIIGIVLVGIFVMFQVMLGLSPIEESLEPNPQNQFPLETTTTNTTTTFIPTLEQTEQDWDKILMTTAVLPLRINDFDFLASVALTPDERLQGLSGTTHLPVGVVKLFDFEIEDLWGIWMKDMNYSIDIVWLNNEKRVVHIETEVLPETYPTVFRTLMPARYVVEIEAGLAQDIGLQEGDVVEFDLQ